MIDIPCNVNELSVFDYDVPGQETSANEYFYKKILSCVSECVDYSIELRALDGSRPYWFCWTSYERGCPDERTIKWVSYKCKVEIDLPLPLVKDNIKH
mgnify:FL=1